MENLKRVFVFSGKMGSGKSTYASVLRKVLGEEHCKIFKFAEIIYALHDKCLPILKEEGIVPQDIEKEGDLLQVLGTQYGRECKGENVWIDVTERRVKHYLSLHSKNFAIIDDCRFENEFDAFHPIAHMIRLTAPKEVRRSRCSSWRERDNHESEIGLDDYEQSGNFDYIIETDSELPGVHIDILLKDTGYIII